MGQRRADAHRRSLSQGPQRPGPGRQKPYDGKVNWRAVSRFERLATADEPSVLDHQGRNHGQWECHRQGVGVVQTQRHRYAVRFSTDVDREPQRR
jgi:hypothetical protein